VAIPLLDEEEHVADQLAALAGQTYAGAWEVLVVDNGCTDGTIGIVRRFDFEAAPVRVVAAPHGLNRARNAAAAEARGDLLAFCDGDDVVAPDWLEQLVEAASSADLVGGALEDEPLNDAWARGGLPPERATELLRPHGFLPCAPGGNCAVWTEVARSVRWDERFEFGSSDIEFSWRAQLAGRSIGFAPGAVVLRRYSPQLARRNFAYGVSAPLLYRRFRAHGMRRNVAQARAEWRWLVRMVPGAIRRRSIRARWLRIGGRRVGRLAGSVRYGVFFP